MEEINELFVDENKLNAAVAEANTLPTISITKVTDIHSIHSLRKENVGLYGTCLDDVTYRTGINDWYHSVLLMTLNLVFIITSPV